MKNTNTEKNMEDIFMSKVFSILIMALIAWGVVFITLQGFGIVHWKWYWVVSPIFIAAIIYIIMVILAVALGMEIE